MEGLENKAIMDSIDAIGKKIDDQKKMVDNTLTEQKSAQEKLISEFKSEVEKENQRRADEAKQFVEDLAKTSKTLGEMREELTEFKAKQGRPGSSGSNLIMTASQMLARSFKDGFEQIKGVKKGHGVTLEVAGQANLMVTDMEYKSQGGNMTLAADLTGNAVANYMLTPAVRGRRKVQLRDLIQIINSATGIWKFYRQNNPVGVGSIGFQGTAGSTKQQLEYQLTEVTVTTDFLAGFVRFAKQMAQDLPFLQTFIANELIEDYKRQESGSFIPTLNGAATGVAVTSGANLAEKIIDNIAVLLGTDYDPNTVLTNATQWGALLKTKPNDYSIPGGVTIDEMGNVRVVGVPVLVSNNMPTGTGSGTILVGDFSKAAIIQTEGLSVNFYEQDSDNVQKNLITAKVEARVGLAVMRPDAFVLV